MKAIKNNAIWIAVVPALVTAIGLVFAVLTERIRWAVAFKTVVFMPMAISLFATGVIWHVMYIKDPNQGAVNAGDRRRARAGSRPPASLQDALPSTPTITGSTRRASSLQEPSRRAASALLGLTGIPPDAVPAGAKQAVAAAAEAGAITGVVWRDF